MLAESLDAVLTRYDIQEWDLLLVGDGSGSMWKYPLGWGCVAIEQGTFDRKIFYGCMNDGTVNMAELLAYLAPLSWYTAKVTEERKQDKGFDIKNIHIFTDSQYARDLGNAGGSVQMKKNTALWAAFELYSRQGFKMHWHWLNREDMALNFYVDALSKAARGLMVGNNLEQLLDVNKGLDVQKLNQWE